MLTACLVIAGLAAPPVPLRDWQGEVVYQIFPRSFRDSNNDRIGDLNGITQELGAIQELGCTAILLNPIQKSRVYHNYFPDDFYSIDPAYGSLQDFHHLLGEVHRRHMKLILDMEQQYVADKHPWYRSMAADPNKDTPYLWRKNRMDMWDKVAWYNGATVKVSPVNLNNPAVRGELVTVFRYWADQGVDGFRLDHMMDDLDGKHVQTNLLTRLWKPIEDIVRKKHPAMFFIGEQADWWSNQYVKDIFAKTPTDAVFAFPLREGLVALDKKKLESAMVTMATLVPPGRTEFTFLENHDTERYASLEFDPRRQRLATALLFLLKGTPSIYSGQELGMKGVQGHGLTDGNDIPVRLAYRWTARREDQGTAIWYKDTGPWWSPEFSSDHDGISLAEEEPDPESTYNYYRSLIRLRQSNPEIRTGSQEIVPLSDPDIVSFFRRGVHREALVFANLSESEREIIVPQGDVSVLWPNPGKIVPGSRKLPPYGILVLAIPGR